jgi:hypothetical protein
MDQHRSSTSRSARRWSALLPLVLLSAAPLPAHAAATVTVQVDAASAYARSTPSVGEATTTGVGDAVTIKLAVAEGRVSRKVDLPLVDGLIVDGAGQQPAGETSTIVIFFVTPKRAGDVTIPAFDFNTDDGQSLHVEPIKLHVIGKGPNRT